MSCSGSGADPEAPPVSAPAALPASTAAENKASPAGTAGGPGAGAAAGDTGPLAARAGEPAERRGCGRLARRPQRGPCLRVFRYCPARPTET
ncbi:transcription initiation factor TFIID subunit 10-like [Macaca thibetana thibetana]|uniref:transcription initiation factor TFIID subunit 10-like n=1 Tax=Macaca thibetana thibetana TaxID=257877 RepID=UPI0021BCDE66|nr:transcription initiation factor TFIID subunit 10-like [Macaca thibetana thibetana]